MLLLLINSISITVDELIFSCRSLNNGCGRDLAAYSSFETKQSRLERMRLKQKRKRWCNKCENWM